MNSCYGFELEAKERYADFDGIQYVPYTQVLKTNLKFSTGIVVNVM